MANKGVRETVTSELLRKETKKNVRIPYLSGAIRGMGELKFSLGGFIIEMKSTNKDFIDEIASMIEDIYQSSDIVERFESLHSYTNEYFYCIRIAAERSADLLEKCCIVRNKYEFIDNIPDELQHITFSFVERYMQEHDISSLLVVTTKEMSKYFCEGSGNKIIKK